MKNQINILLIEDNCDDVFLITRKIKQYGISFKYTHVQNGIEMQEALVANKFDIIISDYALPGFNAMEALKKYKEHNLDIPFLIVSGTIGEDVAVLAMKEGATDYLMKDRLERLAPAIEKELLETEMRRQKNRQEKALYESEVRYKELVELSPDGILIVQNGKIKYCNSGAQKIFATGNKSILNSDIDNYFISCKFGYLVKNLSFSNPLNTECKLRKCNNEIIDTEMVIIPVAYNEEIAFQVIIRDITAKKAAQEELNKISAAVVQSPVGIIITDTNGIIEFINPKFTEISGFTAEEIKNKKLRIFKEGILPADELDNLLITIKTGKEWKGEVINVRKNGEKYWENISISPILNGNQEITHFIIIKEDISSRKKMEQELISEKERAEIADNLKSEFLAQMSHEIRSPINVLLGFTSLLRSELEHKVESDLKECFKVIGDAGRRIIRTIDLILNMSEIQTNSYDYVPKKIDLYDDILKNLYTEYKYMAAEKGLELNLLNLAPQKSMTLDEYSVTQIFANLLDNAINYTEQGKIEIKIDEKEKDLLSVKVSDTGIGISDEYFPNLFKPFTQETQGYTRKFEGNGLGLALVKNYCKLNNADINVKSKKGEGTQFEVNFKRL